MIINIYLAPTIIDVNSRTTRPFQGWHISQSYIHVFYDYSIKNVIKSGIYYE